MMSCSAVPSSWRSRRPICFSSLRASFVVIVLAYLIGCAGITDSALYELERRSAQLVQADSLHAARSLILDVTRKHPPHGPYQERVHGYLWARLGYIAFAIGDSAEAVIAYAEADRYGTQIDTTAHIDWLRWSGTVSIRNTSTEAGLLFYDLSERLALLVGDSLRIRQARECRAGVLRLIEGEALQMIAQRQSQNHSREAGILRVSWGLAGFGLGIMTFGLYVVWITRKKANWLGIKEAH